MHPFMAFFSGEVRPSCQSRSGRRFGAPARGSRGARRGRGWAGRRDCGRAGRADSSASPCMGLRSHRTRTGLMGCPTYRLEQAEKTSRPSVPAWVLDALTQIGTTANNVGVMSDRLQTAGHCQPHTGPAAPHRAFLPHTQHDVPEILPERDPQHADESSRTKIPHNPPQLAAAMVDGRKVAPTTYTQVRDTEIGAGERIRTADRPLTRRMLCQLSYTGVRLPRQGDAEPLPGYRFLATPGNGHRNNRASPRRVRLGGECPHGRTRLPVRPWRGLRLVLRAVPPWRGRADRRVVDALPLQRIRGRRRRLPAAHLALVHPSPHAGT